MEEAGLVETEFTLAKALRRAFDYCKRLIPMEVSAGINPYIHTFSVSAKIFPREPPSSLATAGMLNVNDLLTQANLSFQESGDYSLWVLLDRLDAAFDHAPRSVERDTLAALFRCYMDLKVHNHISMKILLRSDVFRRVTMKGYRELSHLERRTNLEWKSHMLLNLMLRRILSNVCICSFMDVDRDRVLADFDKQQAFFYRVFPKTIGGSNTLEWLFARTTDASNETAPRELIQFLNELKTMQIRRFEVGAKLARRDGMLFSEEAFREALRPVSNNRLENTLYAEYSELRHRIRPLAQGKIEYKVGDLTRIWGVDDKKAVKIAKQLENVGFFEKLPSRSARQSAHWRIPLLYRPALSLNGY